MVYKNSKVKSSAANTFTYLWLYFLCNLLLYVFFRFGCFIKNLVISVTVKIGIALCQVVLITYKYCTHYYSMNKREGILFNPVKNNHDNHQYQNC